MSTYIIGDVHGAGQELLGVLDKISPGIDDRIILVGDAFDRGVHAHLVWDLIKRWGMEVFMGNHEYKMMHWMQGKRDWLPNHYYVALNLLMAHGVTPNEFLAWLEKRPLLRSYGDFVVTHAAVNPAAPDEPGVSWNVFGNISDGIPQPRPKAGDGGVYFWDRYKGDKIVVYGHLVTQDNLPRIRTNTRGKMNSIGIDTAAVHGGPLTAYCPEKDRFYRYESKTDWGEVCKAQMKVKPPIVDVDLMAFVVSQRGMVRERLGREKAALAMMAAMDGHGES